MADKQRYIHDQLLDQGARQAPEPETAEQRSKRLGIGTAAGGVVAVGGAAAAKFGVLKLLLWVIAGGFLHWGLWAAGAWVAIGVVVAALLLALAVRSRGEG